MKGLSQLLLLLKSFILFHDSPQAERPPCKKVDFWASSQNLPNTDTSGWRQTWPTIPKYEHKLGMRHKIQLSYKVNLCIFESCIVESNNIYLNYLLCMSCSSYTGEKMYSLTKPLPCSGTITSINVGNVRFCKPQMYWNITIKYVASLPFFRFNFSFDVVTTICLRSGEVEAQNHLVRVLTRSCFGIKYLFWSPQTQLEMPHLFVKAPAVSDFLS